MREWLAEKTSAQYPKSQLVDSRQKHFMPIEQRIAFGSLYALLILVCIAALALFSYVIGYMIFS